MLYNFVTSIKRFFGFADPHEFEHNFEFLGYASAFIKTSRLYRDEFALIKYQRVVKKALTKYLLGSDVTYITEKYHHPVATMDMILTTLRKGDLPDHEIPEDEHFERGFNEALSRFAPPFKIRPVHFADLRFYKWNWHPNVEEPFYSDRQLERAVQDAHSAGLLPDARMSFGNLRNVVFIRVRQFLHQIKRNQITNTSILWPLMKIHVKPALTPIDEWKTRVIYGVSKMHVLPQAMFFWPLFNYYINADDDPLLWGFETVLGGLQKLYQSRFLCTILSYTYVTIDWSGFDLRSLFSLQRKTMDKWETWFDFSNGYIPTKFYHTSAVDPQHLKNLWDWQRDACFNMPFVMPDHTMYSRKYRCIPSGLFITQFLDSCVNLVMIMTILDAMGFDISKIKILVQGDDSVIRLHFLIPADQHAEFKAKFAALASYYFDHQARAEKTELHNAPDGVEVLGYTNWNGYPKRDWRKLLAQLYHPRGAPSLPVLKARCCGFAYASMYEHPQVINVLKDIYDHLDSRNIQAAELRHWRDVLLYGPEEMQVQTDHFPTLAEVTRFLRSPFVRTQTEKDAYWPSAHFLADH